jgi:ectoine hydroxylase-related dioxygenase (phytanoyl-CoA dioxygenase family)
VAAVGAPYLAVTLDGSYGSDAAALGLRRIAGQLGALAAELALGIVFVPHVGQLGERAGGDVPVGRRLERLLRLAGVPVHVAPVLPVGEAAWLSHRAALTISSRYHPLVFASAAARPCLGLYRDDYTRAKLHGALAHVGAERWCLPTSAAEAGGLLSQTRELWAAREETCAQMEQARSGIHRREAVRRAALLARLGLASPVTSPAAGACGPMLRGMSSAENVRSPGIVSGRSVRARPSRTIPDDQWDRFSRDGFLHLGQVLEPAEVEALAQRADDLAMGRVENEHVQMQLDTGGAYEALPGAVRTFEAGTRMYRKIQGLEMDDLFVPLIRHQRFFEACAHIYGPHVPLSIFRAMVMNKPAGQGTHLPWHQDGGDVWALDREPLVTIWIALDGATTANGCMEAVRGSHQLGLLSDYGSTVSEEHAAVHCPPDRVVPLEVAAGHAVLLHNWLIHRSGINPSPMPRRAVTICYLDGRTRSIQTGDHFPLVAGSVDHASHPYVAALESQVLELSESAAASAEYARSLATTLDAVRASHAEAEEYARSLAGERARLAAELAATTAPVPSAPAGWRARRQAGR